MARRKLSSRRQYAIFCLLLFPLLILAGCDSGKSNMTPTPTAGPAFQALNLGIPQKALQAPVTGQVPESQVLHIGVSFKLDPQALKRLNHNGTSSNQQDGTSLAQSLGVSNKTYQEFKSYFGIEGASVNLSQTRTWLTVDIKAGSLAQLLQTKFVLHKLDGRVFYTPDPAHMPKVPAQIASQILSISGLDNYSQQSPRPLEHSSQRSALSRQARGNNLYCPAKADWPTSDHVLYPSDLAQSYGLTPFWQKGWYGQKQSVILVEPQDTYIQNDINTFFTCEHFKGSFQTVTLDGVPSLSTADGSESDLDIEMIASMAPMAQITDYQGDSNGAYKRGEDWTVVLNDLLQRIIDDYRNNTHSGTVVSISLQADETTMPQSDLEAIDQSLQILTQAEHMSVFVATGDCAAFATETYGQLSVSWPSDDPWAIAVGGTALRVNGAGNRSSEIAWSDASAPHSVCNNMWGTGGGVSTAYAEPQWQQQYATQIPGLKNRYSNGGRQAPDLSTTANYVMVYMNGQWTISGGTSAATPIAAAGLAVLNGAFIHAFKLFFFGPAALYDAQANAAKYHPFYDVTQGDNIYYQTSSGWDYPTGLGAPNYIGYYYSLQTLIPKS